MSTRASLEDVKLDLQERSSRWYEIEKICGFNIMANPGLHALSAMLNKSTGYLGYSSELNTLSTLFVMDIVTVNYVQHLNFVKLASILVLHF